MALLYGSCCPGQWIFDDNREVLLTYEMNERMWNDSNNVSMLFYARLLADLLAGALAWYAAKCLMKALPGNGAVPMLPDRRFFGLAAMFPKSQKRGKLL